MKNRVAVIVPFKKMDAEVRRCLEGIFRMDFQGFDLILLPDGPLQESYPRTKVLVTGPVVPAVKRNTAIFSEGYDFFASIDSDAYPERDWLSRALPLFDDESVCAVGGPNLIPPDAGVLEKAAYDVTYARLGLATAYYRGPYKGELFEAKEVASSNLILRRDDVLKTKGYDTARLTGEDTILCFSLRDRTGKRIIFSPHVRVYHRRAPLFRPHLRRVFRQAKDKVAFLLKPFWLKNLVYFVPAFFVLFLALGLILSFFSLPARIVFLAVLALYFILVLLDGLRSKNPIRAALFLVGLPLTHIVYGLGYILGALRTRTPKDSSGA
jgi:cellulose synthase/poly-beta-1,6-N-acetylglucosamine synthase-like glycosyltransferase